MKTKEGLHGNVESDSEDGCTKEDKHGILYPNYSNTHVRTQTHTHTQ